jgi:hypothetical protein
MRIETRVEDLVWRIGDDQTQVGYSVARRLGGWTMLCAIRIIHTKGTRSTGFPV